MENNISTLFIAALFLIVFTIGFLIYSIQEIIYKISEKSDKLSLGGKKSKRFSFGRKIFSFFNIILTLLFIILFISFFVLAFAAGMGPEDLKWFIVSLAALTVIFIIPGLQTYLGLNEKMMRGAALFAAIIMLIAIFIYFLKYIRGYEKIINDFFDKLFNNFLLNF